MSASNTTQHGLLHEVDAMVAALMGDALPAEITSIASRLEAALDGRGDVPADAGDRVRTAIGLLRNGQPCAAVSALLSARVALGAPPR